jgi:hypothetical protein
MPKLIRPKVEAGRIAEIFPWKENRVIKLFHARVSSKTVEREARLPVPAVEEIIEIENRIGLVYQRIEGLSMLETLGKNPGRFFILPPCRPSFMPESTPVSFRSFPL